MRIGIVMWLSATAGAPLTRRCATHSESSTGPKGEWRVTDHGPGRADIEAEIANGAERFNYAAGADPKVPKIDIKLRPRPPIARPARSISYARRHPRVDQPSEAEHENDRHNLNHAE